MGYSVLPVEPSKTPSFAREQRNSTQVGVVNIRDIVVNLRGRELTLKFRLRILFKDVPKSCWFLQPLKLKEQAMRKNYLTGAQIWTAVGVAVLVSWVVVYAFANNQALSAAEKAAWVQAVFSVGAILVAIWISSGDRRHDREIRGQSEKDSVISIIVLIQRGQFLVKAISGITIGDASVALMHSVNVVAEKLESLDLISKPSPVLLDCSLHAANYLRMCENNARKGHYKNSIHLVDRLAQSSTKIMRFYGINESDFIDIARA